jgi:hypothetical protein
MIRIRFKNSVVAVKEIEGYKYNNDIVFRFDGNKYTVIFHEPSRAEAILDQACEYGFINLDKEKVTYLID